MVRKDPHIEMLKCVKVPAYASYGNSKRSPEKSEPSSGGKGDRLTEAGRDEANRSSWSVLFVPPSGWHNPNRTRGIRSPKGLLSNRRRPGGAANSRARRACLVSILAHGFRSNKITRRR